MVVRTGRGGSGGIFRADDAHSVNVVLYPTTVALALQHAAKRQAQEEALIAASRTQARIVGRSGRGGVGNVRLKARPKIKQKKQKRQEEQEEEVHVEVIDDEEEEEGVDPIL